MAIQYLGGRYRNTKTGRFVTYKKARASAEAERKAKGRPRKYGKFVSPVLPPQPEVVKQQREYRERPRVERHTRRRYYRTMVMKIYIPESASHKETPQAETVRVWVYSPQPLDGPLLRRVIEILKRKVEGMMPRHYNSYAMQHLDMEDEVDIEENEPVVGAEVHGKLGEIHTARE